MKTNPNALYLTDNGAALCGAHLGATAKATGRDRSGQKIYRVTGSVAAWVIGNRGTPLACETCKRERKATS